MKTHKLIKVRDEKPQVVLIGTFKEINDELNLLKSVFRRSGAQILSSSSNFLSIEDTNNSATISYKVAELTEIELNLNN